MPFDFSTITGNPQRQAPATGIKVIEALTPAAWKRALRPEPSSAGTGGLRSIRGLSAKGKVADRAKLVDPHHHQVLLRSAGYAVPYNLDEINFRTQLDWYYDDKNSAYNLMDIRFGDERWVKAAQTITLKSLSDQSDNEFLIRDEYEATIDEVDLGRLTSSPSDYIYRLTNAGWE